MYERIGLIGGGKMGAAILRGVVAAGIVTVDQLMVGDPSSEAREKLGRDPGVAVTTDNRKVCESSDALILAVYPQVLLEILRELKAVIGPEKLIITIAAGVPTEKILTALGPEHRVARAMPNTPLLLGEGASGYCLAGTATVEDGRFLEKLLSSLGRVWRVDERQMDAVTGLAGSGPAYVFSIVEALSDGGVRAGLPRAVATQMAAQTVLGAAKMVLETGYHTGQLKDQVTSAGGTTIAGIHALEAGGLRAAIMNAVWEATKRSQELGD